MNRIKIALVEDDELFRASLVKILEHAEDFELMAACGSAEEFLERAPDCQVLLVDLGLPGLSGQELISRLRETRPELECIAHTVLEESTSVLSALRAGAVGYLLKGCTPAELLRSLRTLPDGGAPLTARIARMLIREVQPAPDPLSQREHEVLQALSEGYSYKQVAARLVVSAHTVHTHVKHIYEKLQVSGRRQALSKARQQGWLREGG